MQAELVATVRGRGYPPLGMRWDHREGALRYQVWSAGSISWITPILRKNYVFQVEREAAAELKREMHRDAIVRRQRRETAQRRAVRARRLEDRRMQWVSI